MYIKLFYIATDLWMLYMGATAGTRTHKEYI